jgi:segregation and condensation protein A
MTDYKVQLENFYGPFDLLLHLVKEDELNIYDIPIARITEQYITYIDAIKQLNVNLASDFLVMAATLMEIKSRTLLPRPEDEPEEDDPRFELVKKLIEYKKYKDLSKTLSTLIENQSKTHPRPYIKTEEDKDKKEEPFLELDLWGLVKNYSRISKEIVLDVPMSIIYDDVPLEHYINKIMERLQIKETLTFTEVTSDYKDRLSFLKNFLAILDLAKEKKISVEQEKDFSEITIKRLSEEEIQSLNNDNPAEKNPESPSSPALLAEEELKQEDITENNAEVNNMNEANQKEENNK